MGTNSKKDKHRERRRVDRSRSPIYERRARDGYEYEDLGRARNSSPCYERRRRNEDDDRSVDRDSAKTSYRNVSVDIPESTDKQSLSIEETNALRAKLGLKPLETSSNTSSSTKSSEKTEVLVRVENANEKAEQDRLREKLSNQREKRKHSEKLRQVKGLGESDSDDDASAWVKKSRMIEIERKRAAEREKLLAEMDNDFGVSALVEQEISSKAKKTYTGKDLKGVEVAHDMANIKEGQDITFILKDKGVLDEEGDVLENYNIAEEEKIQLGRKNKVKSAYDPYGEEEREVEVDEFGIVRAKKSILEKYDEEAKKTFKIGESSSKSSEADQIREKLMMQRKKTHETLTTLMPTVAREYMTEQEIVAFKKPKKIRKVRKANSKLKADDLLGVESTTAADFGSRHSRSRHQAGPSSSSSGIEPEEEEESWKIYELNISAPIKPKEEITDDDFLQQQLERARRLKQTTERLPAEMRIAQQIKREPEEPEDKAGNSLMLLNATEEFCRTLGTYPTDREAQEPVDDIMDYDQLDMDIAAPTADAMESRWNEVDNTKEIVSGSVTDMLREPQPILEAEPNVSVGVASALELAKKKGYVQDASTAKAGMSQRMIDIQAKHVAIEEKFYEDDRGARGRDRYVGPVTEFKDKDKYKPEVKLEYIDDHGRILDQKEAFRYLSHKFHGKQSGKNKVDKRARKLEQTAKLKQMCSTDTPLNTLKLLQEKQRDLQTPYILLSGGSKALGGGVIGEALTKNK